MSTNSKPVICLVVVLLITLGVASRGAGADPQEEAVLRAGAATSNITPWLGLSINGHLRDRTARYVHDELHARCLVVDDGDRRLSIVVCDSCMIPREICDAAKERIEANVGLSATDVLICATHTHSAPTCTGVFQSDPDPEYQLFLARKIADAVAQAVENLAPARVGWGVGRLPQHVFNRRWKMKPGAIPPDPFGNTTDRVRMNPPRGSADLIEPAGPTDPDVLVLAVEDLEGRPIAVVANYALHYVGGVGGGHISADYFGAFARRMEESLDRGGHPQPVAMLSNGASGDINNIDFTRAAERREPYQQIERVAGDLAAEVRRVLESIEYRDDVDLGAAIQPLKLGVRRPSDDDVARAREILAAAPGADLETRVLKTGAEVYARETVLLREYPEEVEVALQTLRIGDLAIAAIPCEVFVEIGREIKEKTPFRSTFVFGLANGYNGYLPTVEQHALGGYETWRARSSYLEVDAASKIVSQTLGLLEQLHAESRRPPGVLYSNGFEDDSWRRDLGARTNDPRVVTVSSDPDRKFEPLRGRALRIRVDEGGHYGASLQYRFERKFGEEPEEIYFRYYLRFADDWDPRRGGKLPGISGTYGRAGWGGRRVNGRDGWSARGLFEGQTDRDGKPVTPVGFYCYHADMKGRYGSNWRWDIDGLGQLENSQWYCIEQYARMNTPGKNDGILRAWIDDRLAFEKTDVRMRDVDTLKIETIWLNVYLGGSWTAASEHHLYVDEMVISRQRIGSR